MIDEIGSVFGFRQYDLETVTDAVVVIDGVYWVEGLVPLSDYVDEIRGTPTGDTQVGYIGDSQRCPQS